MQFFDQLSLGEAAEIANAREMRNGALVLQAKAARGGNVQDYLGAEVGKPEMPVVRVYRDADEVFRADSLRTFGHKPVTLDHPPSPVTPTTWRDVARGHVGEEVLRDGEFVRIPMLLADQTAIEAVKDGKRELSVGYQCDLDWTPGTTPDGRAYDARQTNIVVDHVAIVDRGRAGPECRIGDQHPAEAKTMRVLSDQQQQREAIPMPPILKTMTIDGHTVEMSDAAVVAVSGLQKQIGTLTADNLQLTAEAKAAAEAHAAAIKAKDAELADARKAIDTKDGEIAVLKKQVEDSALTPDKLAAAVAARAAVIDVAKTVIGATFTDAGKTDAQIRREVVTARLGDSAKDLTDGVVEGAFLAIAKDQKPADPLARTIADGVTPTSGRTAIADAYAANVDYLTSAWKSPTARAVQ
ncbi:DUF2213 domain-containing protein [Methylobacterium nodulans]|uniref:DUF2213 domain-containing protein n=1 Tax=Methylobacterium nodulans (strain LMG 21967 / CNCM I-2342 / ORS 2060) TaxID=460265 RepID=B8IAK6_METNO|nr:DUF2213 domain-containing protein [Methylobacterium nodulans]ACL61051.1 conserved hypothetical protein [Methylobacterium nodulans ORS 2060]